MILTANEFAEIHGIDYAIAAGTIRFLVTKGIVRETGKRPQSSGKGKPSTLYDIPETPISLLLTTKGLDTAKGLTGN